MFSLIERRRPFEESKRKTPPHKAQSLPKHKLAHCGAEMAAPRPPLDGSFPPAPGHEKKSSQGLDTRDKRASGCYALMQTGYAFSRPAARALGGTPPFHFGER
jgi:hypothetical protein